MDVKETAEASANRIFDRLKSKHGMRSVLIAQVISSTEVQMGQLDLTPDECATVVIELQVMLDDWRAFRSKN